MRRSKYLALRMTSEIEWSPEFYDRIVSLFWTLGNKFIRQQNQCKIPGVFVMGQGPGSVCYRRIHTVLETVFLSLCPVRNLTKGLQKTAFDKARGILVVSYWKTRSWYPLFTSMLNCSNRVIAYPGGTEKIATIHGANILFIGYQLESPSVRYRLEKD